MRLFISAAEPSGDLLAAELFGSLPPTVAARGLTGPALRAAGVETVARMESVVSMGVAEVLARLPSIQRARGALHQSLLAEGADAALLVDAPDLHLPMAAQARRRGLDVVGYVSPQVWAWRPGRIEAIAAHFDQLLCLFDFEPPLYAEAARRHGCDVRFVGHPLLDRVPRRRAVDPDLYALLPGSRPQELRRHLPIYLDVAARLQQARPQARFCLRAPADLPLPPLPPAVQRVEALSDLSACRAALTKSGTITLELAVMGVPMVVAHAVHPLTYGLGRMLISGVQHIALPNILAGAAVVPERVQHLDPAELCRLLLDCPPTQAVDLRPLGAPGASRRAADALLEGIRARR